jgi:iron complex outermembrane receptor protein
VTASRHEQANEEAPSSLTIITAREISAHGYQTLAEALRGLAGLYVSNDRNYEYLGVRGFSIPGDYNTRVLLLVDGHPINENVWSMAGVGTDGPIDLNLVDRIEVVRGPGSALYGTSAILAVVQVITRRPTDRGRWESTVGIGSYGDERGSLSWSGPLGKNAGALLSISGLDRDGSKLFFTEYADQPGSGFTRGTDYDRFNQAYAAIQSGPLTLTVLRSDRTKGIPTAAYDCIFGDSRTNTIDRSFSGLLPAVVHEDVDLLLRGYTDWCNYKGPGPPPAR